MKDDGFPVCCIHSDMDKGMRQEAITSFRKGTNRVLISSDITARGIDIQQVSLVLILMFVIRFTLIYIVLVEVVGGEEKE